MAACNATESTQTYVPEPVLRAYLYAGEPVRDIRLTWTTTLDASDTIPEPINDAQVRLIRNGVTYVLEKALGDSGYYQYPGTDLLVAVGDVFALEADVDGRTLTARTEVPPPPGDVTLSSDTVKVFSFGSFTPGQRPDFSAGNVKAQWPSTGGALYYVVIESLEASPVAIADSTGLRFGPGRRVFAPTAADTFTVTSALLTYYGQHRLRVYRVNQEYAQLYATRQQDSRDLNEPLTNVNGGLGVFSAFASDTVRFVAVQP